MLPAATGGEGLSAEVLGAEHAAAEAELIDLMVGANSRKKDLRTVTGKRAANTEDDSAIGERSGVGGRSPRGGFRVKALYVAEKGKRPTPGVLETGRDCLRFTPTQIGAGQQAATSAPLVLQYEDLLEPITRCSPRLDAPVSCGPGGAHHKAERAPPGAAPGRRKFVYLHVRVKLLFGLETTPDTLASYWFALMPHGIDFVFDALTKAARSFGPMAPARERSSSSDSTPGGLNRRLSESDRITLMGKTVVLQPNAVQYVRKQLPGEVRHNDWTLGFSTYQHGLSLRNMFRQLELYGDSPCVTVIRDAGGAIFGSYQTEAWRKADRSEGMKYYGGGESFVFTVAPAFQTFRWSQKNRLFMMSDAEGLIIGGGSNGQGAALVIDGDLCSGSSGPSETYTNAVLASSENFRIQGLEVWLLSPKQSANVQYQVGSPRDRPIGSPRR